MDSEPKPTTAHSSRKKLLVILAGHEFLNLYSGLGNVKKDFS